MKNNILLVLVFLSGAVCGGAAFGVWKQAHTLPCAPCLARPAETELLLAQLEEAGLPDDVKAAQTEQTQVKKSTELPSQLVRSDLPEDIVLGVRPQPDETDEAVPGIVLDEAQNTIVLNAQKPAQRAADGTSITMIEAPVAVKRIQTLDDYKAFKREARGAYPQADFAKEEVLVLESQSNLPDKVFEIVSVQPEGEQLRVLYRVNVFGLDKKVNTHSAQKISKTSKPIVLEQVL